MPTENEYRFTPPSLAAPSAAGNYWILAEKWTAAKGWQTVTTAAVTAVPTTSDNRPPGWLDEWMDVSVMAPTTDSGGRNLLIKLTRNAGATLRTGAPKIGGYALSVTQAAVSNPTLTVSPASTMLTRMPGQSWYAESTLQVDCNSLWAWSGPDWISASLGPDFPWDGAHYDELGLAAAAVNPSVNERTGYVLIRIWGTETVRQVTVTQPGSPPHIALSASPESPDHTAQTIAVLVDCNTDWSLSQDAPWATWTGVSSGGGDSALPLMLQANDGDGRTLTVSGCYASAPSVTATQIEITQSALPLRPPSASVTAAAQSYTLHVSVPGPWTVSTDVDWVSVLTELGDEDGGDAVLAMVVVKANGTPTSRQAVITVGTHTHQLTQAAAAPTLTVSPVAVRLSAYGGLSVLRVTSSAAWTAQAQGDWLSLSASAGTGDYPLVVTATENTGTAAREGGVLLRSGDLEARVEVSQAGGNPHFSLTPTLAAVAHVGGTVTLGLQGNMPWTAAAPDWITCAPSAGDGDALITATVAPNPAAEERAGLIIVNGRACRLDQAAAPPRVVISPDIVSVPSGGGAVGISVESNTRWTVSAPPAWAEAAPAAGSGDGGVEVRVRPNPVAAPRHAVMYIGGRPLDLTQEAPAPYVMVTPGDMTISSLARSYRADVRSNTTWLASTSAAWLRISPVTGNGDGGIKVAVAANPGPSARTAELTVTAGSASRTHTVTQHGVGGGGQASDIALRINGKSPDDLGLCLETITLTNWGVDTAVLSARESHLGAAPGGLDKGDALVITADGRTVFRGVVASTGARSADPDRRSIQITAEGPQRWLEATYQQEWRVDGGTIWSSDTLLYSRADGAAATTAEQCQDALEFAASAPGAAFTARVYGMGITLAPCDSRDLSCLDVLRQACRWHPAASLRADYSGTTPVIELDLEPGAVSVPLADGYVKTIQVTEMPDMRPRCVVVQSSRVNTVDGAPSTERWADVAPAGVSTNQLRGPGALMLSFGVGGGSATTQEQEVVTAPWPGADNQTTLLRWWREHEPKLNHPALQPALRHIRFEGFERAVAPPQQEDFDPWVVPTEALRGGDDPASYPRQLIGGQLPSWRRALKSATVTCQTRMWIDPDYEWPDSARYQLGSLFWGKKYYLLSTSVTATNAITKVYRTLTGRSEPEPWPTGIAQQVYDSLNRDHYQGTVTRLGGPFAAPGERLELTGGEPGWADAGLVTQLTWDWRAGRTTADFAPCPALAAQDFYELSRMARKTRASYRPAGARAAAAVGGGSNTAVGPRRTPNANSGGAGSPEPSHPFAVHIEEDGTLRVEAGGVWHCASEGSVLYQKIDAAKLTRRRYVCLSAVKEATDSTDWVSNSDGEPAPRGATRRLVIYRPSDQPLVSSDTPRAPDDKSHYFVVAEIDDSGRIKQMITSSFHLPNFYNVTSLPSQ